MTDPSALGFCRLLRQHGLPVPVSASLAFHRGLQLFDPLQSLDIYWVGRATLLARMDDLDTFDRVFGSYFVGHRVPELEMVEIERLVAVDADPDPDEQAHQDADPPDAPDVSPDMTLRFSAAEHLGELDFAAMSPDERIEADRVIDRMSARAPKRRSASWTPSRAAVGPVDLRRSLRLAAGHGGEIVDFAVRERRLRPRRVVFLLDISGSMAQYSRALLRFVHAVRRSGVPSEVFSLGTQISRLSLPLGERDPDRALERASEAVTDWAGGTRLGSGVAEFCDRWGQRGLARGAVVVMLSDGWDRGDPELLATQMQRLARLAHQIVWVNPLKATDGYEPLALGMAAALPYCDRFMSGHSLLALEDLAVALGEACSVDRAGRPR